MLDREAYRAASEVERRIENVVLVGQVAEVDAARARIRVRAGPLLTGWLPWATARAGGDGVWQAPEGGEQVVLVAPGGDLEQAVAIGSIYRAAHPAPADSVDVARYVFADGARIEYDRAAHVFRLIVPTGGKIVLEVGATRLELSDAGAKIAAPRIDLN
ncbi:MAG: phage baseplate assembly protein V [Rhodocyclaceae bacterium]|nr:phage baseplate assembly protein V [Rhodocyclaceae bacterium]